MINMEVCANSLTSALQAEKGGAIRVELCDNLLEGGTTPSYAQIKLAKEYLNIDVYPIIRPRGGDFLYSDLEFTLMREDILMCRKLGCDGVVIGILTANGTIDMVRCSELIALARPMKVTFHRAFDMSADLCKALEDVISLGCDRILTSGGSASAFDGLQVIKQLVKQAGDRITIMAGAGVSESNIAEIVNQTGIKEFHGSARKFFSSNMTFKNNNISMGGDTDEYSYSLTDSATVKNLIDLANSSGKILSLRH
ncbi:MAG: copper homeostasis protein CutC [Pedobacter sp.]|nr:copper homeostasis protein CutC [Pedobacter sp.]